MRVLYLVTRNRHTHDFGVDFLYHGLNAVLGRENVFCWPEADSLHAVADGVTDDPCETCLEGPYDSDQNWPRKRHSLAEAIEVCDLAIIATQAGDTSLVESAMVVGNRPHSFQTLWPKSKPIVAVDTGDNVSDSSAYYRSVAGKPLMAYFKRELPIGAHWAIPMPLSYPAARVPQPFPDLKGGIFYHASLHGAHRQLDTPGTPRSYIANDLALRFRNERSILDCELYSEASKRIQPAEYHARMAGALVGISWNGYPYCANWDNNRFWENFAFALAQVAERPRIQLPHPPVDGVHCVYVDSVDQVGPEAEKLARNPQRAIEMAGAGLRHFLQYHSSERRAQYLLTIAQMLG